METAPLVVALMAQKGGAGKSSVAISLAVCGVRLGQSVVLADLDPQGSVGFWSRLRAASEPVVTRPRADALDQVLEAARDHQVDLVVLDTPPNAAAEAKAAARIADRVLIPCRPAASDLAAILATAEICRSAGADFKAVLNGCPPRGPLVQEAEAALDEHQIPVCRARLGLRIAHTYAFAEGLGVVEYEPRSPAADEIRALAAETLTRKEP